MPVSLSGALPAGDRNGLEAIAEALASNQEQEQMVVAIVSCKRVTIHATGRGKKPRVDTVAGILDIEAFPFGSPADRCRFRGFAPPPCGRVCPFVWMPP